MKCKYCQADLEEGNPVCPVCGKENEVAEQETLESVIPEEETVLTAQEEAASMPEDETEETASVSEEQAEEGAPVPEEQSNGEEPVEQEAPQMKEGIKISSGKLAMAIVAGVLVLAIVVSLVLSGMSGKSGNKDATGAASTVTEVPGMIPPDGDPNGVTCKGTYTVSDKEALAAKDTVVATMGGKELTNADLQIYYWMQVYAFINEFGQYGPMVGMDFSKPLDTQMYTDKEGASMTWQQYFLMSAIDAWQRYQSLALEAEAADFQLDEKVQELLTDLRQDMEKNAQAQKFDSVEAMVQDSAGPGSTVDAYLKYMNVYYQGYEYFSHEYEKFVPNKADVEAYFAEHEDQYAENEITKDSGYTVDVRHILVMPKGGTADDKGHKTYSDEEWEACRVAAQEILDQWLAGDKTQESFAKLAGEHSEDPGSKQNGGLYTGVAKGDMVKEFEDWCFDEARQVGDYGLVKTDLGYHIMFFCGSEDIWFSAAQADLISEKSAELVKAAMEKYPAEISYDKIALGLVKLVK